jgi:hypothetical protein
MGTSRYTSAAVPRLVSVLRRLAALACLLALLAPWVTP